MADEKPTLDPSKVEEKKNDFQVDPGMMSLEDLDKIIAQSDPEALKKIEGVREVAAEAAGSLESLVLEDLLEKNHESPFKKRLRKFKGKSLLYWIWAKNRAIDNAKAFGAWCLSSAKSFNQSLANGIKTFKEWTIKQKLLFASAVLLSLGVMTFAYMAFVKKAFNHHQELFITSLLPYSGQTYDISEEVPLETFYNSSRIPKNIFSLKRLVVNILPSESSGPNPMAAYEFSLEGNSTEVLIEIKDREGEIIDQVQRTIESYSFDELNSVDGKKMIVDKVRSTVNRLLTLGKIRYVYIQGAIFKP